MICRYCDAPAICQVFRTAPDGFSYPPPIVAEPLCDAHYDQLTDALRGEDPTGEASRIERISFTPPASPYPAQFHPAEEGGYVVSFRDCPGCLTQAEDFAEALGMAADALACWLRACQRQGTPLPPASPAEPNEIVIHPVILPALATPTAPQRLASEVPA